MKNKIRTLIILGMVMSLMLFAGSCAKKQVAAPGPTQEEIEAAERAAQEERDRLARERAERERAERAAQEERDRLAREQDERDRQEAARQQQARQEMREFESENIYFDFDMSELKPEARDILREKAAYLQKNSGYRVRIEGHCDERGTNEYNIALGERRANAAKDFITALGISGNRISILTYGEEKPADPGHNEDAWAKNRRDEFKLIR
jgi:peptidoglycan-associated lipoprotein